MFHYNTTYFPWKLDAQCPILNVSMEIFAIIPKIIWNIMQNLDSSQTEDSKWESLQVLTPFAARHYPD